MRAPFAQSLSVVLAATLSIPTVVFAAPPPASPGGDPAMMTPEQKLERAKQLFGEGLAALEAGDNATALKIASRCVQQLRARPAQFNFNIGTAATASATCGAPAGVPALLGSRARRSDSRRRAGEDHGNRIAAACERGHRPRRHRRCRRARAGRRTRPRTRRAHQQAEARARTPSSASAMPTTRSASTHS